ncbi:MAG TPA: NADH-quinone oxidoreductase subunit J [Anaerolineales bacterium]
MSPTQIIFLLFALLTLSGAVVVVTSRNLVHAALCMALCFFGVAGLFVLLDASFLAVVAVLIGVGGISILIIFALMLTRGAGVYTAQLITSWPRAMILAVVIFVALVAMLTSVPWPANPPSVGGDTVKALGVALVDPNQYALPFEVASVLLLAALIGSIVIAWQKK